MAIIGILIGTPVVTYDILTLTHGWVKFSSWVFMGVCFALAIAASIVVYGLISVWSTAIAVLLSVIVGVVVMYLGMAAIIITFGFLLYRELIQ